MSQWTHVIGVIRFDSIFTNSIYPPPRDKPRRIIEELDFVHRTFHGGMKPTGSEGPIEINTVATDRGPTVIITGDLRDFGKEELKSILTWANSQTEVVLKRGDMIVRDCMIDCRVEFDDTLYLITNDGNKIILKEVADA